MKVDLTVFINDIEGNPLNDGSADKPLKLSKLLVRALCNLPSQDAEEKFKAFELALKVSEPKEVEISENEKDLIKRSLNVYGPGVLGPIRKHLESL